jgi:hypothetical protein
MISCTCLRYMADETQKAPKSIETDYDSDSVLSQALDSYEESEGQKIFITQSTYRYTFNAYESLVKRNIIKQTNSRCCSRFCCKVQYSISY